MSDEQEESKEIAALRAELVGLVLEDLRRRPDRPVTVALGPEALAAVVVKWKDVLDPLAAQVIDLDKKVGDLDEKVKGLESKAETLTALDASVKRVAETVDKLNVKLNEEKPPPPTPLSAPAIDSAALKTITDRLDSISQLLASKSDDQGSDGSSEASLEATAPLKGEEPDVQGKKDVGPDGATEVEEEGLTPAAKKDPSWWSRLLGRLMRAKGLDPTASPGGEGSEAELAGSKPARTNSTMSPKARQQNEDRMIIIGGVIALIAVVIIVIISWRNADGDPSDSKQVEQPSAVSASGSRQPDGINEAHDASAILEPSGINALLDPANAATTNIAEEPQ